MTILEAVGPGVAVLGLGCVLLLWGAEEFMEHLGAVAALTGIPVLALGLLLAGAEPEELATALIASSQGHPVLAATDAIGANVTMLTLGLGLAFLVQPVAVDRVLRRYALIAVVAGVLALAALADGHVGRWEAGTLCAVYVAVVAGVWHLQRRPPAFGEVAEFLENGDEDDKHEDDEHEEDDEDDADDAGGAGVPSGQDSGDPRAEASWSRSHGPLAEHPERADPPDRVEHAESAEDAREQRWPAGVSWRAARRPVGMVLAGLAAMVVGGALAVDGAARLALASGLGEHATGLSALAFATSAEVLALVVAARRRALTQVAVGGVLGSAIYNATLTLGAAAYVGDLAAPDLVTAAAIGAALPLVVLGATWRPIGRVLGGALVVGYLAYIAAVVQGHV